MSRRRTTSVLAGRAAVIAAAMLAVVVPTSVHATPAGSVPSIGVTIDVSSRSCETVAVDYRIDWEWMLPTDSEGPVTVELVAVPGDYLLASESVDFGHKADKFRGKIRDEIDRESGYFDHQTYPGLAYQIVLRVGTAESRSNAVAIPDCVPMSPTSGPAAGGTVVTVIGGGTFGGDPFTMDTRLTVGDVTDISPISVAPDGSSLQFLTPPGPASACVSVFTQAPGLPFPLPAFCYSA